MALATKHVLIPSSLYQYPLFLKYVYLSSYYPPNKGYFLSSKHFIFSKGAIKRGIS